MSEISNILPRTASEITIGDALLAAVVLLGALWRLTGLGDLPLSSHEAAEALAVVAFWAGETPAIGSPGFFTLTALLRPMIGMGDGAMRFVPAVFGTATLALPLLLRHRIGMMGALMTAALLAFSPTHIMLSRTAGGDALAVFAAFLLFGAWVAYRDRGGRTRFLWMAAALGMGLLSAPLFYTFLVAMIGIRLLGRLGGRTEIEPIPTRWWRTAAVVIVSLIVALGTMLMVVPAGLGAVGNQVALWFTQFSFGNEWAAPLQTLLYEAPLLLFGVVALIYAMLKGGETGMWLVYMALLGLLIVLFQQGIVANILVIVLPVYIMIGALFGRLLQVRPDGRVALVVAIVGAWGLLALVNVGRYTKVAADNIAPLIITLLFFLLISLVTFAIVTNTLQGVQGIALGLLCVCIFFSMGTGWTLAHETGNHPREAWTTSGTDQDIRLLRDTLHEASYQLAQADDELRVVSLIDTPVMRWYLSGFEDVQFVDGVAPGTTGVAVIAPEASELLLGDGYASASFDIAQTGEQLEESFDLTRELKWRFFKENRRVLLRERATIWLYLADLP